MVEVGLLAMVRVFLPAFLGVFFDPPAGDPDTLTFNSSFRRPSKNCWQFGPSYENQQTSLLE
jgi:hypothetical protein